MTPTTIRIGAIDYKIVMIDNLRDDGDYLNGHIVYDDAVIKLNSDMEKQREFVALWHETIHGILEQAGIDHNEQTAISLGFGIVQVLRDNELMRGEFNGELTAV